MGLSSSQQVQEAPLQPGGDVFAQLLSCISRHLPELLSAGRASAPVVCEACKGEWLAGHALRVQKGWVYVRGKQEAHRAACWHVFKRAHGTIAQTALLCLCGCQCCRAELLLLLRTALEGYQVPELQHHLQEVV